MSITYPFEVPAIRVMQPIGIFYVTVLPAELMLQVARTDRLQAEFDSAIGYHLKGTQRQQQDKRLSQIVGFLNRGEASFPNAIIIAANYNFDIDIDQSEVNDNDDFQEFASTVPENDLWYIKEDADDKRRVSLVIPTPRRLAAIIDGQHRLFAFAKADTSRLKMDLICSIFVDLPKSFQAQLFATINSNQKPVDRSLTFELFGYNIDEEPEKFWTPDKLAVYFARRLAALEGSPLYGRIKVAPKKDDELDRIQAIGGWAISTAVVVDGILRLITSNPKRDSNAMNTPNRRTRTAVEQFTSDKSPLRDEFIINEDRLIYQIAENYLAACNIVFWDAADATSYIRKTTGVQALFDILRKIVREAVDNGDVTVGYFVAQLQPAAGINFAEAPFNVAAGAGRSKIREALELAMKLPPPKRSR